ncbi:hypothetical protein WA538_002857 [Blastocystis sp. DL]
MKVKTIEIAWHRRPEANHNDPVLSVDFLDDTVFATGGGDHEVKIWRLNTSGEEPVVEYCASLKGHQQSVNVVRFSPDKTMLASAGDDGCIIIWGLREKVCSKWCDISKENCYWKKNIRGHAMDIYDISWCPNSQFLVSSGTDSNVIIWGVDGTQYQRIHDHSGYIQGIDWSQDDATIISVANDRTARVYSYAKGHLNTSLQTENGILTQTPRDEYRISRNIVNNRPLNCKMILKRAVFDGERDADVASNSPKPSVDTTPNESKKEESARSGPRGYFMFLGDTVPSFYRRPSSSFDGLFTVIPCGIHLSQEGAAAQNCSYMYLNGVWEKSLMCLPVLNFPAVIARFSPRRYELDDDPAKVMTMLGKKHYDVFAVTTTEEVFIYSTRSTTPLYYVTNIHYAQICDFAWNASGTCGFTASSDGYCTLFQFEEGELGKGL